MRCSHNALVITQISPALDRRVEELERLRASLGRANKRRRYAGAETASDTTVSAFALRKRGHKPLSEGGKTWQATLEVLCT